jgi:hypothetical protein
MAEDRLITAESPEVVYAIMATDRDLVDAAKKLPGVTRKGDTGVVDPHKLASPGGRELVSRRLSELHRAENDTWDQIVILRNRLFLALVLAVSLTYAVLAMAVLRNVTDTVMTAAVAFFLVGAVVGVFNELYLVSRPNRMGSVFDYGLGHIRLLVTPILSGLAGVGGVLITTLTGPFLFNTAAAGSTTIPTIAQIFNLGHYSMGLVVAAIFGLTPGLLLTRLRNRSDDYKSQIEELSPAATGLKKPAAQADTPVTSAVA